MDNIEQVCESMVGLSVEIRGVDCGRIMRWVCVEKDGKTFYVFVFSSGKKIEATGVIHYVRNRVHYPSGSEYVLAQRKIKPKFGGRPAFPNTISNRTNLRGAVMPKSLPHERELNSKLKNRKDK
jgi:hypothetical protein